MHWKSGDRSTGPFPPITGKREIPMTAQIDPRSPAAAPTTVLERGPRVSALTYDERSEFGVQTLIELAAFTVASKEPDEIIALIGDERRAREAIALAEKINATFEPEVPAFERGEKVSAANGDPASARLLGKVDDRYLNERGEWEYHVRLAGAGLATAPYAETEIAPFPHQGVRS